MQTLLSCEACDIKTTQWDKNNTLIFLIPPRRRFRGQFDKSSFVYLFSWILGSRFSGGDAFLAVPDALFGCILCNRGKDPGLLLGVCAVMSLSLFKHIQILGGWESNIWSHNPPTLDNLDPISLQKTNTHYKTNKQAKNNKKNPRTIVQRTWSMYVDFVTEFLCLPLDNVWLTPDSYWKWTANKCLKCAIIHLKSVQPFTWQFGLNADVHTQRDFGKGGAASNIQVFWCFHTISTLSKSSLFLSKRQRSEKVSNTNKIKM